MTRMQTSASSLVAAIPAGFLAYLLVTVFLNHAEQLTTITQVLVGGTLATVAAVVLTPFAVLIFGGKSAAKADKGKTAGKAAAAGDDDADFDASDEIATFDGDDDEDTETIAYSGDDSEGEEELFEDSDDETDFLSDDEILTDDEHEKK